MPVYVGIDLGSILVSDVSTHYVELFTGLYTNLQNAYLPTMAEDLLQEVRKAGGTFYGE